MIAAYVPTFGIQRQRLDGSWQDVATRDGYDVAKEMAAAWTERQGIPHRVVDDHGRDITPIEFETVSDEELKSAWTGILLNRGDDPEWAETGADLRVELRQQEQVRCSLKAVFKAVSP